MRGADRAAASKPLASPLFVPYRIHSFDLAISVPYSTKTTRTKEPPMELYFAPLACSLATRISLYEAGAPASGTRFTQVDTRAKRLGGGGDFFAVNPMGQVPVLRTDAGELLTENTAVLQYVADRFPDAKLAPRGELGRARLRECLGFIGTELHKAVFVPLLDAKASEDVKAYSREKIGLRLGVLEKHLAGRENLDDAFSISDTYLATVR